MKTVDYSNKKHSFLPSSVNVDYELLDFGRGRKLERFGQYIVDRPEITAKNSTTIPQSEWKKAHWYFYEEKGKRGIWKPINAAPSEWQMSYEFKGLKFHFLLRLTGFKHLGIFPEQAENWRFLQTELSKIKGEKKVLNLFAYTGAASIIAAKCGAKVTNVDSVKQVLNWGRENAKLNNVDEIRWILEDARRFVSKSVRRGDLYHGIIMDPPAFGFGTKGEKWKLEKDINSLLEGVLQLLHPDQHFFILNTYSPRLSLNELKTILQQNSRFPKKFEATILCLKGVNKMALELGNLVRYSK